MLCSGCLRALGAFVALLASTGAVPTAKNSEDILSIRSKRQSYCPSLPSWKLKQFLPVYTVVVIDERAVRDAGGRAAAQALASKAIADANEMLARNPVKYQIVVVDGWGFDFDDMSAATGSHVDLGDVLEEMVRRFGRSVEDDENYVRHVMYFTGVGRREIGTGTVGMAYKNAICTRNSQSLVLLHSGVLDSVAETAAHEIAHSFGLNHDGANGCSKRPSGSAYIMSPNEWADHQHWSSCSQTESHSAVGCFGCLHGGLARPSNKLSPSANKDEDGLPWPDIPDWELLPANETWRQIFAPDNEEEYCNEQMVANCPEDGVFPDDWKPVYL